MHEKQLKIILWLIFRKEDYKCRGFLNILCGWVFGLYLGFGNNKLVEKAVDNQIKNEILNK